MVFTQGPLSLGESFSYEHSIASVTFSSDGDSGTPSISVQAANLWYDNRGTYIVRFVADGCRKNLPLGVKFTEKMRPRDLLHKFVTLAPAFETQWESDDNYCRNADGSFSLHGVCTEFSDFFRRNYAAFSEATVNELFDFVEWNLVEPAADETPVDNALCTCFLENISSEPCGEFARGHMGRKSRAFFDQWHTRPPY